MESRMNARPGADWQLGLEQLQVASRLGTQHLDAGAIAVDAHVRTLAAPDHVGHQVLFDHQVRHRGFQRLCEVLERRQGGRRPAILHLAHETFREPGGFRQLLHREPAAQPQVTDLATQLHGVTSGRERGRAE